MCSSFWAMVLGMHDGGGAGTVVGGAGTMVGGAGTVVGWGRGSWWGRGRDPPLWEPWPCVLS